MAKSDSLITIVNGAWAQRMQVPDITYREMSPSPLVDFAIAYHRDNPSPILANLLEIAEDLARAQPPDGTPDGELLVAALD